LNMIIWGISGIMGRHIQELASEDSFWKEIIGVNSKTALNDLPKEVDIIIDFSQPESLEDLLSFALKNQTPILIGTTGHDEKQVDAINKASGKIPILHASNTSLGMNLLFSLVRQGAKAIGKNMDIEIVESHHRRKKDAPSGSALSLKNEVEEGLEENRKSVYGRRGECLREQDEIGIHAIRGGDIKGVHHVYFINDLEQITLSHEAMDRKVFASGAIEGAKYLIGQKAGLYSMKDVLGLKEN